MAILALIVSANISLLMIVLLLASSPNSSPELWLQIRLMMGAIGAAYIGAAFFSLRARAAGAKRRAAIIGAAPALFSIVLFGVLLVISG